MNNHQCMYRQCKSYSSKPVIYADKILLNESVTCWKWNNKINERVKLQANGIETKFTVSIIAKQKMTGTLEELKTSFVDQLQQYCFHRYNIYQYKELNNSRVNLKKICVLFL